MGAPDAMSVRGRRLPALDGVRAIAVAVVIAYHLNAPFARGGYLGVDLFFVLSGFLITSLLVEERVGEGRIALGAFWARRARRLLPGLILMLLVLGGFYALFGAGPLVDLHAVREDALATIGYVANWHQLFAHQTYFAQFEAPSPLQHTWSLGIEEQFYLLWPFAVVAVMALGKRAWRSTGLAVASIGAAASAGWMAYLSLHGASVDRLYYGTDTRAADLLVGATVAFAVAARQSPSSRHLAAGSDRAGRLLSIAGPLALAGFAIFAWRAGVAGGVPSAAMFQGGFLAAAVLAAIVIADVRRDRNTPLVRALSVAPVVFIGRISYELYLWHWPVICELTPARLGFGGVQLTLVRIGVTAVLSVAAFFLVDQPLRRFAFRGWPAGLRVAAVPAGMAAAAAVMVVGTVPVAVAQATNGTRVIPVSVTGSKADVSSPVVPGAGGVVGGAIHLASTPTRANPLRVVLFGDSVMRGDAPAMTAALQSTGAVTVKDDGFDGWGFTTDTTWRTGVPVQIEADHAQVVIAMWSYDDDFLLSHSAEYRTWLTQFVQIVTHTPGVEALVFQQFPPLGPPPFASKVDSGVTNASRNHAVDEWNALARSLAAANPSHVAYLPLGPSVERNGGFSFWLPPENRWSLPAAKWVRVRSTDAVHFCAPGAARYADAMLADLTPMFHLPAAAPDWSVGSWKGGTTYSQPPGFCPDNHPGSLSYTG